MNRHFFFTAGASLAFVVGCGPSAQGGGGTGTLSGPSTTGAGGSSAPCSVCSSSLAGDVADPLCEPSQTALDSLVACACAGACAAVCGNAAAGSCLDAWGGNPPLECKTCLVSTTGCSAAWEACLADDGVTPIASTSSSSGSGGACSCDPALPLCPGGGSCATPGAFDGAGDQACGSAEYCAPCCDPGNACAVQGACKVTKSDQAACSLDYECCSGVCTAGKCDGGCGILINF